LNRERRASGDGWRAELAKVDEQIQGIVEAIKEGMFQRTMIAAMDALEARKAELAALLADAPADTPDMLPSASLLYAKKVDHLTEALNRPEDRAEAAQALRGLTERIALRPGPKRGQIDATLYGELGTILSWTAARNGEKGPQTKTPAARATGVSVSMVAGIGFEPMTFRL
jgi:site-specific DNA recombinase